MVKLNGILIAKAVTFKGLCIIEKCYSDYNFKINPSPIIEKYEMNSFGFKYHEFNLVDSFPFNVYELKFEMKTILCFHKYVIRIRILLDQHHNLL